MNDERGDFSYNDLQLLLTLQEDPLQTYSNIASNLGKSVKTISRWVSRLEASNLFQPIRAILDYPLLGLEVIDVIVEIKNLKNVKIMEKFCDSHPLTAFRTRINGAINGLYLMFLAPKNTRLYYQEIFDSLKNQSIITSSLIEIVEEKTVITKFNLNYWNNDTLEWSFNWDEWEKSFEERKIEKIPKLRMPQFNEKLFNKLDYINIYLLRLLNINAKIKLKEIEHLLLNDLKVTESLQRISERVNFLKKNFIIEYRLNFNPRVLDIYNTLFIKVKCNEGFKTKIKGQILLNPPPFPGYFRTIPEGFIWYISMPATHFSKVSSILWREEVEKYEVSFIDYANSDQYQFWEEIWDRETKNWKNSKDFIVNDPLRKILENK